MRSAEFRTGFFLGLLLPLLGCLGYGLLYTRVLRPHLDLSYFFQDLFLGTPQYRSSILSLGLIANVPLFFWFDRRANMQAMRGVLLAMFIHGAAIVILYV
jgi:hypothetical protein